MSFDPATLFAIGSLVTAGSTAAATGAALTQKPPDIPPSPNIKPAKPPSPPLNPSQTAALAKARAARGGQQGHRTVKHV